MAQRYFTLEEAQAALPRLRDLMGEIQRLKAQADAKIRNWREGLSSNPVSLALARGQVEFLMSEVHRRLNAVGELGCVPKDLDIGLVDFPTRIPGVGEGHFCWKLGEPEVSFWHGLTEGYSGRKPLQPFVPARRSLH